MKIEVRERRFPTCLARLFCQRIYGHVISDEAWRNWKKWASCPAGRQTEVTGDRLITLMAIASLRSKNRYQELSRSEIQALEPEISDRLLAMVREIDKELVLGRDVRNFVASYKVKPPAVSTVYNKIPSFSYNAPYSKNMIFRMFAI